MEAPNYTKLHHFKIVHIFFMFNIGGAETMLVDIVNEQCKTDEVSLIIIDDSYNKELLKSIDSRVKIVLLGRKSGSKSPIPIIRLNMLLLKSKPDVIHIHNWQTAKILLPFNKVFFTVHGLGRPTKYYGRLRGIIAISEAVKKDILAHGDYNVKVIPNGILINAIEQKKHLSAHDPFRILQVGRLKTELKGQDILINAVAKLKSKGTSVTLDIIGEGESRENIELQIKQLGLEDCVRILGSMTRNELYSAIKDYDLLCQPSRKEGFGLTVAEAMAARIPVLVSNSGGPYEIIEEGAIGYSFASDDSESCALAIDNIIDVYGSEGMSGKVECAYQKALNNYSIEKMVSEYKLYYKNSFK